MLKLILADNQAIFRAGIAKVLAVEDEMRIVAQAQTQEQMFMALDKFRAAVLVIAGGFHNDFNAILQAATRNKTRVVVLADTGESAQRYMGAGAHGVVYRNGVALHEPYAAQPTAASYDPYNDDFPAISADQGRKRRYYAPTAKGRAELEDNLVTWKEIARGMRLVPENSHA